MINPESIKSNSNKSRANRNLPAESDKKTTPNKKVVTKNVRSKKSGFKSLVNTFVPGDPSKLKNHLWSGVMVPTIKSVLHSALMDTIDIMIFGEAKGRRGSSSSRSSYDNPSYRPYYHDGGRRVDNTRRTYEQTVLRFDREDLVYNTIEDAEYVLRSMKDTLKRYPIVTVLDLYEFSDRKPPYTAKDYGWSTLDGVEIKTIRDSEGIGYILTLRKPLPID